MALKFIPASPPSSQQHTHAQPGTNVQFSAWDMQALTASAQVDVHPKCSKVETGSQMLSAESLSNQGSELLQFLSLHGERTLTTFWKM